MTACNLTPSADNAYGCGTAALRWANIYAISGVVATSDERKKEDIVDLDEAELAAAKSIKSLIKRFLLIDDPKGKLHVGVIAQEVVAAFAAEGLNAHDYAIIDYDEDSDVYGVRYDQLAVFMIAAL